MHCAYYDHTFATERSKSVVKDHGCHHSGVESFCRSSLGAVIAKGATDLPSKLQSCLVHQLLSG